MRCSCRPIKKRDTGGTLKNKAFIDYFSLDDFYISLFADIQDANEQFSVGVDGGNMDIFTQGEKWEANPEATDMLVEVFSSLSTEQIRSLFLVEPDYEKGDFGDFYTGEARLDSTITDLANNIYENPTEENKEALLNYLNNKSTPAVSDFYQEEFATRVRNNVDIYFWDTEIFRKYDTSSFPIAIEVDGKILSVSSYEGRYDIYYYHNGIEYNVYYYSDFTSDSAYSATLPTEIMGGTINPSVNSWFWVYPELIMPENRFEAINEGFYPPEIDGESVVIDESGFGSFKAINSGEAIITLTSIHGLKVYFYVTVEER